MSPTRRLMGAMMKYGLRPGSIIWDHLPHRFPGKGKSALDRSGWYVAFSDREGAVFGDYSRGLRQHWRLDHYGPFDKEDLERWRRERKELAKELAENAEFALAAMREDWNKASDVVQHFYLDRKGIHTAPGLRLHDETLFIPAYEDDGTLSNIQRIYLDNDGRLQKRFWKDRSSKGCSLTLAAPRFLATKTLWLCEGWATGWTIQEALNVAVVVAFNDHGLVEVGKSLRAKYPDAKIIVCADNDQWSTILKGKKELPNPGVIHAREACEAINGVLRIPQFEDLDTKPTDFNDLRQLEGMKAVRHWLKNSPPDATPVADEVAERIERDREDWRDTALFRCLGYNDGHYYYFPQTTGQLTRISTAAHSKSVHMIVLHTDSDWWARHWPGPNKSTGPVDWLRAMMALMDECHGKGVFVPDDLPGIGAWRNESGGVVIHLGDRLLPPGEKKYVKPETYEDGSRVYQRLLRDGPEYDKVMKLAEARNIYRMFTEDLAWANEAAGALLAGWTVLAPFCGALSWRPAVWLTGIPKSGKWIILEDVVAPLLGGMRHGFPDDTEAILQMIKDHALPVLYDVNERDRVKAKRQVDAVNSLIRVSASTGADMVKGSPTGKPIIYRVRSMFCLASTGGLTEGADKSRITILPLKSWYFIPEDVRAKQRERLQRRIADLSPPVCRRLFARTAKKFGSGEFDEILKVTKAAAEGVFGDPRSGDQYGSLCAGAWMLIHDGVPKEDDVRNWMLRIGVREYVADSQPEGHRVLWLIIQAQETVEGSRYTVRELVEIVAGPETERRLPKETAELHLKTLGIRVVDNALHLANRSEWIKRKMSTTPFAESWRDTLRTIEGVEAGGKTMRFSSLSSKTTRVPLPLRAIFTSQQATAHPHT